MRPRGTTSASRCRPTNDVDGAIDAFRDGARPHAPDFAQAHWNLSLALLALRQIRGGLARIRMAARREHLRRRAASDDAALGRRRPATGARCCSRPSRAWATRCSSSASRKPLASRGARVIVRAPAALRELLASAPGVAAVADAAAPLPAHDLQLAAHVRRGRARASTRRRFRAKCPTCRARKSVLRRRRHGDRPRSRAASLGRTACRPLVGGQSRPRQRPAPLVSARAAGAAARTARRRLVLAAEGRRRGRDRGHPRRGAHRQLLPRATTSRARPRCCSSSTS